MAVQPSFAQDDSMQFGVKAGLNLAKLDFGTEPEEGVSFEAATKFGLGGTMLYPLSEVLGLQVEALYLLKGMIAKIPLKGEVKYNFTYISVPVMGRYNLGSGDISPYIAVGPEFGFQLSANAKIFDEEGELEVLKSIELGFNIGAGVSMTMGDTPMFGEIRYSLGLSDINDFPGDDDIIKTKGIQFFVGMMF